MRTGDKVICINNRYQEEYISIGSPYVIHKIEGFFVYLKGVRNSFGHMMFSIHRFKKA